jgi:2',3'-cyclic-nucleotide 2'-phosphodiesterase (5'-nucleotidase family)
MQRIIRVVFAFLLAAAALPGAGFAAGFSPGTIVVLRSSNTGAGTNIAVPVYLDEYNPSTANQATTVQSLPLPTAISGSNKQLTITGNSGAEGSLRRSTDGRYLTLAGYAAANLATTTGASRVVGRVDVNGNIDTTTVVSGHSTASIRGAVTTDGSAFWVSGSVNGAQYVTLGSSTSTQLNTALPTNLRWAAIFNNQLYVDTAASNMYGVLTIGSGLPTTGSQTTTLLAGFPTSGTHSSYGFFFANSNTLYVADSGGIGTSGGGIQKWTLNAGTWTLAKNMNNGVGCNGLTGYVNGSNVVLFATTNESSANRLVTLTDPLTDTTTTPAFTVLATAAASNAFRGVELAPLAPANGACGADNGQTLTAAPINICSSGATTVVSGSGHPWTWGCNGQSGGTSTASNACSATIQSYTLNFGPGPNGSVDNASLSVDYNGTSAAVTAIPNSGYGFINWTGPGNFTSNANPLTVANVTAAGSYTAHFATRTDGACGSDNGQALAALAPTNLCTIGNASAVTGAGHPWSWTCSGVAGGNQTSCSASIQSYTVSFATIGSGSLSGSTSQTVDFGGSASAVTANPGTDFNFVNWTGTGGFTPTVTNPLTISNVSANRTVTANFSGDITILHVNDTHARVTPHQWVVTEHGTTANRFETVGGAAYLGSELLQLAAANPSALVIDGGDISEGNPIGDMNGNGAMTQFYALLSSKLKAQRGRGMDAVVVGNHDVRDASYIANLVTLQNSGVPVISINVRDANTHLPYFLPYTILTVNNVKVGIIGYTTAASEVGASLSSTLEVAPVDWKSTDGTKIHLADVVNDLRNNQGAQVVVLVAHVGHSTLVDPAAPILADDGSAKLPEVVVTGHWHTWADTAWQPASLNYKTIFTESSSYMKFIGELKVDNTGKYLKSTQHVIRVADINPDPDVQALIAKLTAQYDAFHPGQPVERVVGYTANDLLLDNSMKWWNADEYPWSGNNTAGQWICDAMQWKAQQLFGRCDLAFETGGGVRADIPAGPVTYTQIYESYPWSDDTFTLVDMTGQEIINFLKTTTMDAGFSWQLDVTAVNGAPSVVNYKTSPTDPGSPIDVNAHFKVAITNYIYAHPPAGWTWSDLAPRNDATLSRDALVEYMGRFPQSAPYSTGGDRYHLNTDFSGGYRAVVTMMNDNDTKPTFEYAFIRLLSATPETLARRGSRQVPTSMVNDDGTIVAANPLAEQELYRSYLGFKTGALHKGDIIETWGKGAFYGGNPEFVDQEGIYADGQEFRVVGHDATLAKPTFFSSINSFWNSNSTNHYVQFLAKKSGTSSVTDQNGQTLAVMDVTGYVAKTLPGTTGNVLQLAGVITSESYGLRFRCDNAIVSGSLPAPSTVTSQVAPVLAATSSTSTSTLNLSATASVSNGTYYFTPVADAQIASGTPTSNTNNNNLYIQSSSTSSYGNERAWLRFDISSIPSGATVTGANLQLWDWKATGAALPVEVRGGSDDTWSESAINWNSQADISSASVLDTQTLAAGTVNVWYNWNVGSFVQTKWGGNKLVSLVLKPVTEGSSDATAPSYAFDSKEYGSNAPVLQVNTSNGSISVSKVDFYYRYSADNTTWTTDWTNYSTASSAPYTASFTYPQGTGYYEFYSRATDSSNNVEPAPAAAQAATHYTSNIPWYPIVSLGNVYQVFDGSPKSAGVSTIPDGASVNVTYDGSSSAPTAAGTYTISAASGGTTMAGTVLIIAKAPASVALGSTSFAHDGTAKSVSYTTTPSGLNTVVTYNGSSTAPSAAGTYAVAAVVSDPNYKGGATATMTIALPVTPQVKFQTSAMTYNRATRVYSGTLTVTNTGTTALTGNVQLRLNSLTSGVSLTNADGVVNGVPYLNLATPLNPGQSMNYTLKFTNSGTTLITFTPAIYVN